MSFSDIVGVSKRLVLPAQRVTPTGRLTEDDGQTYGPPARIILAGCLGAATIGMATEYAFYGTPAFPLDDAYIVLHNAQSLLQGSDPVYQAPVLSGSTSVVHTILVAVLLLVFAHSWALGATAWLGVALYAAGLLQLTKVLRVPPISAVALLLLGLAAGNMTHQLLNGLETGLALAAVTWALALHATHVPSRWLVVACAMMPVLRPELIAVALPLLALHTRSRLRTGGTRVELGRDALAFLLIVVPPAVFLWLDTGSPLPGTFAAKRAFFAEGNANMATKWRLMGDGLGEFATAFGAASVAAPLLVRSTAGMIGLLLAAILGVVSFVQFPGAFAHNDARYLYVLAPFLVLALAYGVRDSNRAVRRIGTVLLLIALCQTLYLFPSRWSWHIADRAVVPVVLEPMADWIRRNVAAGSVLLVHDAGYVASAGDYRLVDLVGLKTPSSAAIHRRVTEPSGGVHRADAIREIVRAHRPDYLIVLDEWDRIFRISSAVAGETTIDPVWRSERANDRRYTIYRLDPRSAEGEP